MPVIRLPNKTQWALQDINSRSKDAQRNWDKAMKLAAKNLDPHMVLLLARLRDDLAFMERTAILALNGDYQQPQDEPQEARRA